MTGKNMNDSFARVLPHEILNYWFGELADGWTIGDRNKLWFGGDPADDAEMRARFGDTIARAKNGKMESWRQTPDKLMAYILLLDQMTRATGRGTPDAFAGDQKALAACKAGIAAKIDMQIPAAHCRFFLSAAGTQRIAGGSGGMRCRVFGVNGAFSCARKRIRRKPRICAAAFGNHPPFRAFSASQPHSRTRIRSRRRSFFAGWRSEFRTAIKTAFAAAGFRRLWELACRSDRCNRWCL